MMKSVLDDPADMQRYASDGTCSYLILSTVEKYIFMIITSLKQMNHK